MHAPPTDNPHIQLNTKVQPSLRPSGPLARGLISRPRVLLVPPPHGHALPPHVEAAAAAAAISALPRCSLKSGTAGPVEGARGLGGLAAARHVLLDCCRGACGEGRSARKGERRAGEQPGLCDGDGEAPRAGEIAPSRPLHAFGGEWPSPVLSAVCPCPWPCP